MEKLKYKYNYTVGAISRGTNIPGQWAQYV